MTQSTQTVASKSDYFVSATWLNENLGTIRNDGAVLVETGAIVENGAFRTSLYEYAGEGHIPGAVFVDMFFQFSDSSSSLSFTKPSTLQFQDAAAQLGITPETEAIIYDRPQGEWASRLVWLFAAWGHKRVRVLDGGWQKWKSLGGAIEQGINKPTPKPRGTEYSQYDRSYFASTADVRSAIESGGSTRLICGLPAACVSG
ncbi:MULTISPECIES: rhodanese-like domain-containing protein [unclassified Variovorax]|uniref:sulfurtransferase n=1 Tax=unclassified Variovorax TaxID=663243 RepID=UPI0025759373|nr:MULTISPECIES: rhodanese-like domain-containing protein [unclassified Variovorax]MDM0087981.1 rhodanese-like domain-containing protein [Variovorax sp. J22G40]MDM0146054.1 rhodanese-like domain-containing protein [Variovorax sp. J2P1-31]